MIRRKQMKGYVCGSTGEGSSHGEASARAFSTNKAGRGEPVPKNDISQSRTKHTPRAAWYGPSPMISPLRLVLLHEVKSGNQGVGFEVQPHSTYKKLESSKIRAQIFVQIGGKGGLTWRIAQTIWLVARDGHGIGPIPAPMSGGGGHEINDPLLSNPPAYLGDGQPAPTERLCPRLYDALLLISVAKKSIGHRNI